MPNGASDCCGTCSFNRKNKGEPDYKHAGDPEAGYCDIRDRTIANPLYTLSANHPHRNQRGLRVPIGPVYKGDSFGHRRVWIAPPDSEDVRMALIEILKELPELTPNENPIGLSLGRGIITHLVEINEPRAIPELLRISQSEEGPPDASGNTAKPLIELARAALGQLHEA